MTIKKPAQTKYCSRIKIDFGTNGTFGTMANGNTKRLPAYKNWCFTLNNYSTDDTKNILGTLGTLVLAHGAKYIFQEEQGENGTKHLQGFIDFGKRVREPTKEFSWTNKIHWEKARSRKHAIAYCHKSETRVGEIYTNIEFAEEIEVLPVEEMASWQKEVISIVEGPRDKRTIHWFWEPEGGIGKTALSKYLALKHEALILSGKATDMYYGIIKYAEKRSGKFPKIIILDVPRSTTNFISFQGIESVKNGLFFSSKYESDMCIFNCPHVLIFANEYPDTTKLSKDRWDIRKIEDGELRSADSAPPLHVGGDSVCYRWGKRQRI